MDYTKTNLIGTLKKLQTCNYNINRMNLNRIKNDKDLSKILSDIVAENYNISKTLDRLLKSVPIEPEDVSDNFIKVYKPYQFEELRKKNVYVIAGVGVNLDELRDKIMNEFANKMIMLPNNWYYFIGRSYNYMYKLSGKNRYQDDLCFVAFDYDKNYKYELEAFKSHQNPCHMWYSELLKRNGGSNNEKRSNS